MKYFIYLLVLLFTLNLQAQNDGKRDRIHALKIAFITNQLDLSSKEAQQFWPIYNTFEEENNRLRQESFENRKGIDFENLNEQEAKTMLNDMISIENQKSKLREKFVTDLLKVLPAKKIILLKITEDAFNKRMLEEMKKRRGNFQD